MCPPYLVFKRVAPGSQYCCFVSTEASLGPPLAIKTYNLRGFLLDHV